jgi:hypothetical protein
MSPAAQPSVTGCLTALDPLLEIRARDRRLLLLVLAIVLMSLVDLSCTLTYMRTTGMIELNPLARQMVAIGQAQQLILFKLFTTVLSCGALYLARRNPKAELCAWLCTALMVWLMIHWVMFNHNVHAFTDDLATLALTDGEFEPRWVKIDD